ncbi:hypothetical protein MSPP1_003996 [Malassezia sp. CBS 17886]|nr:hypothetical protein MSPP1_003996 [Malassezia sp. CBS 17886]
MPVSATRTQDTTSNTDTGGSREDTQEQLPPLLGIPFGSAGNENLDLDAEVSADTALFSVGGMSETHDLEEDRDPFPGAFPDALEGRDAYSRPQEDDKDFAGAPKNKGTLPGSPQDQVTFPGSSQGERAFLGTLKEQDAFPHPKDGPHAGRWHLEDGESFPRPLDARDTLLRVGDGQIRQSYTSQNGEEINFPSLLQGAGNAEVAAAHSTPPPRKPSRRTDSVTTAGYQPGAPTPPSTTPFADVNLARGESQASDSGANTNQRVIAGLNDRSSIYSEMDRGSNRISDVSVLSRRDIERGEFELPGMGDVNRTLFTEAKSVQPTSDLDEFDHIESPSPRETPPALQSAPSTDSPSMPEPSPYPDSSTDRDVPVQVVYYNDDELPQIMERIALGSNSARIEFRRRSGVSRGGADAPENGELNMARQDKEDDNSHLSRVEQSILNLLRPTISSLRHAS